MDETQPEETLTRQFNRGVWTRCIYFGLPIWVRADGDGCEAKGFWSWIPFVVGFHGELFLYEGPYPIALWDWLTSRPDQ